MYAFKSRKTCLTMPPNNIKGLKEKHFFSENQIQSEMATVALPKHIQHNMYIYLYTI